MAVARTAHNVSVQDEGFSIMGVRAQQSVSPDTAGQKELEGIVDLERYPVHDLGHPDTRQLIARCREELRDSGCVVLDAFLTADARDAVRAESRQLSPEAAFTRKRVNAYFTEDDPSLPEDDPRRFFMERTSGFVPRDRFPRDSLIRRLYEADTTKRFLAQCFEVPALHDYADPLAGLTINVVPPGAEFPWHYDTNHFAVTLMTQPAEAGGLFEYAPGVRSPEDENLEGAGAVLRGRSDRIRSLRLEPGDLQLFRGRYSLHRVSPVAGETERHMAVFAYCEEPGMIGRAERTRQLFGRVTDAHLENEDRPARNDRLTD